VVVVVVVLPLLRGWSGIRSVMVRRWTRRDEKKHDGRGGLVGPFFLAENGLTCSIVDDITRHCWLDGGNRKIRHTHIMAAVHEHGPGTGTGTGWLSGTGNAAPFFLLSSPRLLPYSSGVHEAL